MYIIIATANMVATPYVEMDSGHTHLGEEFELISVPCSGVGRYSESSLAPQTHSPSSPHWNHFLHTKTLKSHHNLSVQVIHVDKVLLSILDKYCNSEMNASF